MLKKSNTPEYKLQKIKSVYNTKSTAYNANMKLENSTNKLIYSIKQNLIKKNEDDFTKQQHNQKNILALCRLKEVAIAKTTNLIYENSIKLVDNQAFEIKKITNNNLNSMGLIKTNLNKLENQNLNSHKLKNKINDQQIVLNIFNNYINNSSNIHEKLMECKTDDKRIKINFNKINNTKSMSVDNNFALHQKKLLRPQIQLGKLNFF